MPVRVFPHGHQRAADIGIVMKPGGKRDPQRGEPRGRKIDYIVDLGGRPAERLMKRRAMADHAVGGVDRLVRHHARQAEKHAPETRRHDGI